jgi:HK97 family phage major capsid protein
MGATIGTMLGERLGRITNRKFTVGTGGGIEPFGIVNAAPIGFTTASPTAIADTELLDMQHSVDPSYRSEGSWMFHDSIFLAIRKLKDSDGNFIWRSGLEAGVPDSLLGDRITVNQHMTDTITNDALTIVYGQLDKYKIRTVRQMRLRRLEERFADDDQVAFLAFIREDGTLLDAGTGPVKTLKQAA